MFTAALHLAVFAMAASFAPQHLFLCLTQFILLDMLINIRGGMSQSVTTAEVCTDKTFVNLNRNPSSRNGHSP